MDYIKSLTSENIDRAAVQKVLDASISETDPWNMESRSLLAGMGLGKDIALMLLAHHKSSAKYGYDISPESLFHLFDLAEIKEKGAPLKRLFESPFLIAKTCWLYEHAPYFFLFDDDRFENRDSLIFEFARKYETCFLENTVATDTWEKITTPKRIMATTFWERKIFDPILLIKKVMDDNIEGLELNFDFHPFNYAKLLPEDLSREKREQIKKACLRSGVKMDIHSPIVGPYAPSPDPSIGRQRFFNPANCLNVQYETIELAKDIGARFVIFHLIDTSDVKTMVKLIEKAAGSNVRVSIENYCQTKTPQTSDTFLHSIQEIFNVLPLEVRKKNFGITIDVGHFNIEGDDPLVASEKVGKWCMEKGIHFRLHATDNYGNLLFSPPAYSADVHGNVSGRGINNSLIIKLLRSLGHQFDVVAEQIHPLTPEDIATIDGAQTILLDKSYEAYCRKGKEILSNVKSSPFIEPEIIKEKPYQFLTGIEDIPSLKEYILYRKIQSNKQLSVDEAKKISQEFIRLPLKLKGDLTQYIDDFLALIQCESGSIKKSDIDLVCQNISGALFGSISNEHLNLIFAQNKIYRKGDIICEQRSRGREMYFIKKGEVLVNVDGSCVASLGPGEIFGEISLFYNIERSATIIALKDETVVGTLTSKGLENLFKRGQTYARDLIYRFYNILPDRLRHLNDKYKTAIRALHLIFTGDEGTVPDIDNMKMEIMQKKAEFLPTLSQKEAKNIFKDVKSFDGGHYVFAEGDEGDCAYFIVEGKVKVMVLPPDSKEILLGELGEGKIFGEMALIDEKPRSANVVTITPCKLALIRKKAFNEFIETRSDLAYRLMGFICLSLFGSILRLDRLYSDIKKKIYYPGHSSKDA